MKKRVRKIIVLVGVLFLVCCVVAFLTRGHSWQRDARARIYVDGKINKGIVYRNSDRYLVLLSSTESTPYRSYVVDTKERWVREAIVDTSSSFRERIKNRSVGTVWSTDDFIALDGIVYQRDRSSEFALIAESEIDHYDPKFSVGAHSCEFRPVVDAGIGHRYRTPDVLVYW